jgi:hypothetical protein
MHGQQNIKKKYIKLLFDQLTAAMTILYPEDGNGT